MNTGKRILCAALALIAVSSAAVAQYSAPDTRVSLRVDQRQLSEVVQYLRDHQSRVMDRLGAELALTDPILADLKAAVTAFKTAWSPSAPAAKK